MTDERLTDELARHLGWRKAPGRFIKSGRSWTPESRFRPLVDVRDAFLVLESLTDDFSMIASPGGLFNVEVRLAGGVGTAAGGSKARAISVAVAHALGVDTGADR